MEIESVQYGSLITSSGCCGNYSFLHTTHSVFIKQTVMSSDVARFDMLSPKNLNCAADTSNTESFGAD